MIKSVIDFVIESVIEFVIIFSNTNSVILNNQFFRSQIMTDFFIINFNHYLTI